MRKALALFLLCLALPCLCLPALAGNQVEERLSDSARSSLQASIADRAVPVLSFDTGSDNAHKWIFEMSARLQRRIPDRKTQNPERYGQPKRQIIRKGALGSQKLQTGA